jgi:succinate-acetate transporter protein
VIPERVALRPIGSPLPLGLIGLVMAAILLSASQLKWVQPDQVPLFGLAILLFTVPTQLLASILGFLGRDAGVGTGMGVLSATWAVIGYVTWKSPPGATSDALGIVLLVAGACMLVPAATAATVKPLVGAVLALAGLRFGLSGVHEITTGSLSEDVAGVTGIVLAALALYAALALAIEDALGAPRLPTFRRRPAVGEAGVRRPL